MMTDMCRIALIGAGATMHEHAKALMSVPGVVLAGIWNRTRSRAETMAGKFHIGIVADSIPELFEATRADLAVIAVLEPAILDVTKICLNFSWTLLMEKPPGLNLDEALQIQSIARAKARKVYVALNRRFLASTRTAQLRLNECAGKRFVVINDQQSQELAVTLGHSREVVNNWMYANSIHLVDYLRVFGRGHINCVQPVFRWNPLAPTVVVASVEYDSGDCAIYNCIWNGPGPWSVTVGTAEMRWELRPLEQAAIQLRGERKSVIVETSSWDREFKPGFRLQAQNIVDAVRGRTSESVTLDDAVQTMELVARIYAHV